VCSFALRAQKYCQKKNDSEGGEGGREWKWQMQGGSERTLLGVAGALDCWCGLSVFAKQI
jgi:hypothetical protein